MSADLFAKAPSARRMRVSWAALAAPCVLAGAVAAVFVLDPYAVKVLAKVFALWIAVLGLQLLIAQAGVLSLGHAAFVAVGAYVAGGLSLAGAHSLWTMLVAVGLAGAVAGGVIGTAVLRTQGLYQLMATLAVAQMAYYGLQSLRFLGGDDGFALPLRPLLFGELSLESDRALACAVVVLAGLFAAGAGRLRRSEFGALIQAARDDERRLSSLGVNVFRVRLMAFVASAVLAAVDGALLAHVSRFASPQLGHWLFSGELMVLVLLGGAASRLGPLLASAAVVLLQELLAQYTDHWPLALGVLVLLRVLWPVRERGHA